MLDLEVATIGLEQNLDNYRLIVGSVQTAGLYVTIPQEGYPGEFYNKQIERGI